MKLLIILMLLTGCVSKEAEKLLPTEAKKTATTVQTNLATLMWSKQKMPIRVMVDADRQTALELKISQAMQKWNTALGFVAFTYQFEDYADAYYFHSQQNRLFFQANTDSETFNDIYSNGIYHSDIVISTESTLLLEHELLHELGHMLGEQDNQESSSVMKRYSNNFTLSAADVARIKARYLVP